MIVTKKYVIKHKKELFSTFFDLLRVIFLSASYFFRFEEL